MDTLARIVKSKTGMFAVASTAMFLLIGLLGAQVTPYDPLAQDLNGVLQPPSVTHPFGTDQLGRDVLSRVLAGARVSLQVSAIVVAIGGIAGVLLGFGSGYLGGLFDEIVMRIIDTMMAFPGILLALAFVTVMGAGIRTAIISVGITEVALIARVARSAMLSAKEDLYVEAARSIGVPNTRIVARHLTPNCMSPVIVQLALIAADAILIAAGLSFLGLGAQPPTPEWGIMLSDSRVYLWQAPHLAVFPGAAILLAALTFNLLGDSLRRALDVRVQY